MRPPSPILALSRPAGGVEQVAPGRAMSVPAAAAAAITTIQVSPQAVPVSPHASLAADPATPGATASASSAGRCSVFYGQEKAAGLPRAYGQTLTWAPCGYTPARLRAAYGATRAKLTGARVTVAVISESADPTALADANRWASHEGVPAFAKGQFKTYIAPNAGGGAVIEDALDIEAVHGMAPAAKVDFVAGNGTITGDYLLDGLDTVVARRLATVVTSSWYEGSMSATPASMIKPWETGWSSELTSLAANGRSWSPAPPGLPGGGSTGGVSATFAEPGYQRGVVSGNLVHGKAMRAVPDVSALGDPGLGYQTGLTGTFLLVNGSSTSRYVTEVNGGTSLSTPLLAGFEADLIQGRNGKSLGFANPLLYKYARTAAFRDVTSDPQGRGHTEAAVYGPGHLTAPYGAQTPPTLDTMGQCGSHRTLPCGAGYNLVTGLGSPGAAFFSSFGSRPR